MLDPTSVRVTVLSPSTSDHAAARRGSCELLVEAARPLPRAPYAGTVRLSGTERTMTGSHPCRLLKHFTVTRVADAPGGTRYAVSIDLADEGPAAAGTGYAPPGCGVRSPADAIEVVTKRIAGIFGRYCEQFRPPSVVVELGE
jgi:hypothetical protein